MPSPVALVTMPWSSARRGSLALSILKRSLKRRRIEADVLYLNLRLAQRMNLRDYETVAEAQLVGEWLFAQHLFGPFGSREVTNDCETVFADAGQGVSSAGLEMSRLRHLRDTVRIDFGRISQYLIPAFLDECLTAAPWGQYQIVGFTSVFAQQLASLLLAKRLKEAYPNLVIVFGGANVHGVMGRTLLSSFDWVDHVVDGEGEWVFPELAHLILRGMPSEEPLPGVSSRVGQAVHLSPCAAPLVDLDRSPIPDFTDYVSALEAAGMSGCDWFLAFEGSRGCWWGSAHHCRFCGLNGERLTYRRKRAGRIARELVVQSGRHRALRFHACDNILGPSAWREWAPMLASRELDLDLCYETRPILDVDQLRKLRAAGIRHVQIGVESLHSDILKRLRKGTTAIQNVYSLKACREAGIRPIWNVLYGFPGDRPEDYWQMVETIPLLTHLPPPTGFARLILQRFSPFFAEQQQAGFVNVTPARFYRWIYPSDRVRLEDIAYYFDYSIAGGSGDLDKAMEALARSVIAWRNASLKQRAVFWCRRGPGFVELSDTRPLRGRDGHGVRRTVLTGLAAEIYLACAKVQPFGALVSLLNGRRKHVPPEGEVARILDTLAADGLVYAEGSRYLSLALPFDLC